MTERLFFLYLRQILSFSHVIQFKIFTYFDLFDSTILKNYSPRIELFSMKILFDIIYFYDEYKILIFVVRHSYMYFCMATVVLCLDKFDLLALERSYSFKLKRCRNYWMVSFFRTVLVLIDASLVK